MARTQNRGRYVLCPSHPPGVSMEPHMVNRALCLAGARVGCSDCPNNRFKIFFQPRIGDQVVACPRWESDAVRMTGVPPSYVMVRREPCLRVRPFDWCPNCPNSRPEEPPRSEPGWYEQEKRVRRTLPLFKEENDEA